MKTTDTIKRFEKLVHTYEKDAEFHGRTGR